MSDVAFALFVIVDLLGAFGAVLVAVPVLREFGLKRRRDRLRGGDPIPGLESAEKAAAEATERQLARFKPTDAAYVAWGLVIISASYALHIVAEIVERMSAPGV